MMSLWLLASLILGGAVLFSLIGVPIARKSLNGKIHHGHNEVLSPIYATAGVIYAVLIGFLVIAVWENYDAAKANAAEEASILTTMYRETSGMPSAEQQVMREHIVKYTEAVVNKEWALQVHGGASQAARKEVAAMYREYNTLSPTVALLPINADFLTNIDKFADDRNRRTLQSEEKLPGVLWFAIILGSVITVGMSFFIYMERKWPHIIMSSIFGVLIGSLLLLTTIFNQPFQGPLAIDSAAFEHSLSVYKSVDQGN